jgi:hypothetical protein
MFTQQDAMDLQKFRAQEAEAQKEAEEKTKVVQIAEIVKQATSCTQKEIQREFFKNMKPLLRAAQVMEAGPATSRKMKKKGGKQSKLKKKIESSGDESYESDSGGSVASSALKDEASSEEEDGEIKEPKKKKAKTLKANKDKKSLFAYAEDPEEEGAPTLRTGPLEDLAAVTDAKGLEKWCKMHLKKEDPRTKVWLAAYCKKRGCNVKRASKYEALLELAKQTFEGG